MLDFIKNFISKLLNGTSDEQSDRTQEQEPLVRQWQFSDYVPRIPEIILYIRRQREIPRRQLELTLIDKEDEPAWRIKGILRNPWIFHQILHWMETGEHEAKPTLEEVKQMILKHAALLVQEKGVYTGMREMRKHVAWYTTGYPHSAKLRARVNEITSLEELTGLLEQL